MKKISHELESQFDIDPENWLHRELATPFGFEKWTNRPNGIVGSKSRYFWVIWIIK